MSSKGVSKRLRNCLRGLLSTQPFFGSLALRLPLVADPSRQTLASDGVSILYNEAWVDKNTADDIRYAMSRVVMACALKHHTRRGDREYSRWQQASQIVTARLLEEAGLEPREVLLIPDGAEDMAIEDVYELLDAAPSDSDDPEEADDGNDNSQGGIGASGSAQENGESSDNAADPPSSDPGENGEVMDCPGAGGESPSESEIQQSEQEWDEAMHQSAQLAKAQGKMPGQADAILRAAHNSFLPWHELLRRFMVDASRRDFSWASPNRRFIDAGLYMPTTRSDGMRQLVFVVDTSASMSEDELGMCWSAIREAADEVLPETVSVVQCDAAVSAVDEYDGSDLPLEIEAMGRGGTDMTPAFRWIGEMAETPTCVICLTDGFLDTPEHEPDAPVLWVMTPGAPTASPGFGERIDLPEARK